MTDIELIALFLDGHAPAFDTLVGRWQARLYNFVLRHMGDREEARDLCQQAFIQAYRKLDRLQDHRTFAAWLYRIAVNLCRDCQRQRQRRPILYLEDVDGEASEKLMETRPANPGAAPDHEAGQRDVRELLRRALQSLPEEQRVVVVMKEYEGLKFTQIADILQTPVNTVKSRMYYGLKSLRKLFDQWKVTEEIIGYDM